ncbi:unnamed protein product [Blepharisma stoltei]|uniref:Secreted protein n=1 Tax=Blepharisma stoltei TaxID=1481888 RepID=A0AAU9J193_9CILI|nr:unnamed protein product [Blepharisma stoltei]CAG9320617.1 unnamed protein product [Blepharisma stoltei]
MELAVTVLLHALGVKKPLLIAQAVLLDTIFLVIPAPNAHLLVQNVRALQYAQSVQAALILLTQLVSALMGTFRTVQLACNAVHLVLSAKQVLRIAQAVRLDTIYLVIAAINAQVLV